MSRIQELKNHNPQWSKSLIDHIVAIFPNVKSKYVELFTNLLKKKVWKNYMFQQDEWFRDFESHGYDKEILNGLSDFEAISFIRFVTTFIPEREYGEFKTFIDLYEKNLIDTKDITTIESFEQVNELVSIAEMKNWGKELESQIQVVLDNPETGWLLVRPLTYEASKKYGSSTRWCTTQRDNPEYFYRYYKNVLVYCINRKTGYKVAMNHVFVDKETTFWNAADERIDSMMTELDSECIKTLLLEINTNLSNRDLTPENFRIEEEKYSGRDLYDLPRVGALRLVENDLEVPMRMQEGGLTLNPVIDITTEANNAITIAANPPNTIIWNPNTTTTTFPDWIERVSE